MRPESLPPAHYPRDPPEPGPSLHPPRPLFTSVLASNSPAHGGAGWRLRLVEGIQTGEDEWSQVWRCEVINEHGRDLAGSVVLKLYQQSLFPLPEVFTSVPPYDDWNWYPARHLEEREAQAYRLLRRHQGRDVPLCYGFYRFRVPCGEQVVGVILEDLVEETMPLFRLIEQEDFHNRFSMDSIDALACAAFDVQYRLQNCQLLDICVNIDNIHLFKGSYPSLPRLLILGFGKTQHVEQAREIEDLRERYRLNRGGWRASQPAKPWEWRRDGQQKLDHLLRCTITDSSVRYKDWIAMERGRERRRLPYLDIRH
ncbi:hypothetical protein JCM10450v2_004754 [Rhodotorula kratochvilovae]